LQGSDRLASAAVCNPPSSLVRFAIRPSDPALQAILNPRRLLRWVLIGRLCLATAIFIAALSTWANSDAGNTLVASVAFAVSIVVTIGAFAYSEIYGREPGPTFLYLQAIFDLLLVTAVVHITNGSNSPFSALYILVIATAALLVPSSGGLLVAALGIVLYFADVVVLSGSPGRIDASVWMQVIIIALVALAVRFLSVRLRESGEGKDLLVAALEQTRHQAEDILKNIRSGVFTVDASGRLIYANPTAEHLLGIHLIAHTGAPVLDLIGTVAPDLAHAVRRAAESKIRTIRGECTVCTETRRFPVGLTTTYTEQDESGAGRTATAIFQDISDAKTLDMMRLRAERLEGIAELSASMAHEIKNPLASIRSSVEQISRMPAVSDDQRTLTQLVMRESDRLSRLLTEFLDYARVRVAKTEAVDLSKIARDAASLAAAHPDRDDSIRVTCVIPEGDMVSIEGDEDLLHRAVFNLALNAVQASPQNAEVRVEVARGCFDPLPAGIAFEGEAVSLRVTDAGAGIPTGVRERMFDPFFTTKQGGSGLGLAVVHRAIEAHRGLVFVDSGQVGGTRFTVILPTAQPLARSA
jgi:two-component system sensor histidine kinase PilS (NtrC family)